MLPKFILLAWLGLLLLPVASAQLGQCAILPDINGQVTIPASQTSIQANAFLGCTPLTKLVFESNSQLQTIGDNAFQQSGVTGTIIIPASVKSIGQGAFAYCSSSFTVVFESGSQLQTIGDGVFQASGLTGTITIPTKMTTISQQAFDGCPSLTHVAFASDNNLKAILAYAFQQTGLSTITIPPSVTSIENNAFTGSSSLKTAVFSCSSSSSVVTIGQDVFTGTKVTKITANAVCDKCGTDLTACNPFFSSAGGIAIIIVIILLFAIGGYCYRKKKGHGRSLGVVGNSNVNDSKTNPGGVVNPLSNAPQPRTAPAPPPSMTTMR